MMRSGCSPGALLLSTILCFIFLPETLSYALLPMRSPSCAADGWPAACAWRQVRIQQPSLSLHSSSPGSPDSGQDQGFSEQHSDKRGVTGRYSTFAEGIDPNEMDDKEFRAAMRERMAERRRNSPGNKGPENYMDMLQGKKPPPQN
mmetsp:Transcript_30543/g.47850  ORF Transcript_30543/g.47850 Transcript_30543/m.47850 type:complete len:146 (+) Transcript_30543:147-584(+)